MTEYIIPENREATEWRFDDQGLLAGPYSYHELKEHVELGYIKPRTEIMHDDGRKFEAFEMGLFPGVKIEKADPANENRISVAPLPGWNFLAGVVVLFLVTIKVSQRFSEGHWFNGVMPFSMIIGGFAMVLIGCYTGLTGIAHSFRGIPQYQPVFNRIGAVIVIYMGILFLAGGFQDLLFSK